MWLGDQNDGNRSKTQEVDTLSNKTATVRNHLNLTFVNAQFWLRNQTNHTGNKRPQVATSNQQQSQTVKTTVPLFLPKVETEPFFQNILVNLPTLGQSGASNLRGVAVTPM